MTEQEMVVQLQAARETITALRKRLVSIEGGEKRQPFQKQLSAYQQRIEEEQLKVKHSQDWARLLIENALDAIVGMDDQGIITHWNPQAESMFGWKAQEVIGKGVAELLFSEVQRQTHIQGIQCFLEHAVGDKVIGKIVEVNGMCRDGAELPLEMAVTSMQRESKEYFVAILRDISERRLTEQALRETNENLEQLVEARTKEVRASEALLVEAQSIAHIGTFDFDLRKDLWKSGGNLDEILGIEGPYRKNFKGWLKCIHPDDRESVWRYLNAHVYSKDETSIVECRIVRENDGQERWVFCHGKPFFDGEGKPERLLGTLQDVTERKLFENNLIQTQKMEAVGTLVGGVAHEFNNTLAGITGRLYLAKKSAQGNPEQLRHLDKMDALGYRAADMIRQLLAFSRKSPLQMRVIDLSSFMKETLNLHRYSIPENIVIDTSIDQTLLSINGDRSQIQQILVNLLNNARDALEGVNSPVISIGLERFEADVRFLTAHPQIKHRHLAHLSVSDNGCGISEVDQEHIFEPFFTTKEIGKGTGLGLSMVYGALQTHKAVLDIVSGKGRGTEFHIYFPLSSAVPVAEHDLNKQPLLGGGETLLLVDDDPKLRETAREVLEMLGYVVLEASDGFEAWDLYSANEKSIALILMDVVMPGMGGMEAASNIWQHNRDAKVVFCTGYDRQEVLNEGELRGCSVLTKPYHIDELSRMIYRHIHGC